MCAGYALLFPELDTLQWIFLWGNCWQSSHRKSVPLTAAHVAEFLLPSVRACARIQRPSPAPLETVVLVLSVTRLLFSFFIFSLSLSLTAESINNCSAEFLEAFLPLPHFLKSLHTE